MARAKTTWGRFTVRRGIWVVVADPQRAVLRREARATLRFLDDIAARVTGRWPKALRARYERFVRVLERESRG